MVTNPYHKRYRAVIDEEKLDSLLVIDLYYALDEALGKIYELEQTLEGRERADSVHDLNPYDYFASLGKVG